MISAPLHLTLGSFLCWWFWRSDIVFCFFSFTCSLICFYWLFVMLQCYLVVSSVFVLGTGQKRNTTSLSCHCMAIIMQCSKYANQRAVFRALKNDLTMWKAHPKGHCKDVSRAWFLQRERQLGARSSVQCHEGWY